METFISSLLNLIYGFEHDCLDTLCFQRFNNNTSSADTMNTLSKEDLDNLFGPMFEEYFEKRSFDTPINSAAQPTQFHEDSPSTSSIIVDEHEAPPIETTSDEQTSLISLTNADEVNQEDSADFNGNLDFVPYNASSHEEIESSMVALKPFKMCRRISTKFNPQLTFLTKYHPLDQFGNSFHVQKERILLLSNGSGRISVMLKDWMSTPMATKRLDADLQGTLTDQTTHRHMIGGLMYLTASRPDIAYYLKDSGFELIAYSDADHAGCKDNCKSTSGGLQFLVIWMRIQLLDYGYKYNRILMYCDSKSAIAISCNPVQHSKTKHIDIRYHFIKEHVEKGIVKLYFVCTEYQLTDLFTKALPK
ncbi:hypothetical protein Tco_0454267 [Tanacetum coccineum]